MYSNFVQKLRGTASCAHTLSRGGVKYVCFCPPFFVRTISLNRPTNVLEKGRRRRKNLRSLFKKRFTLYGNLMVSSGFSVPSQQKKPGAGEKFGNSPIFHFRPTTFSVWSETPPPFLSTIWYVARVGELILLCIHRSRIGLLGFQSKETRPLWAWPCGRDFCGGILSSLK